jgi:hypothetical protein
MFPIFVFMPPSEESVKTVASQGGLAGLVWRHLGAAGFASMAVLMLLGIGVLGFGLWQLRPWARKAMMLVSLLAACSAIEWLIESAVLRHFLDFGALVALFFFGLPLYYFSRPQVRQAFQPHSPP